MSQKKNQSICFAESELNIPFLNIARNEIRQLATLSENRRQHFVCMELKYHMKVHYSQRDAVNVEDSVPLNMGEARRSAKRDYTICVSRKRNRFDQKRIFIFSFERGSRLPYHKVYLYTVCYVWVWCKWIYKYVLENKYRIYRRTK